MLSNSNPADIGKDIREKEILNYHVLEGMADWVRVVDKSGTIIYANKAMKQGLVEDIVGMKCHASHNRKEPCTFCITTRSIETGEVVQKEENINGKIYSIKSSPVMDARGEIYAAVEVFRNVTRERRLELELINKNKKMSRDLQLAKRIQERMLPKEGKFGNLEIEYIYRPSEMLSGDIFDIFYIDDKNIGIYISDVAGHGISASMMTMFIRQTMRGIKDDILSPGEVLTELHRRFVLLNLEVDKYFTIFYGVFNLDTYEFKYANAGHNCMPIKYNEKNIEVLNMKGYPIAILLEEMNYKEEKIKLVKGDKVLLYTDGITEAQDLFGEQFGTKRLLDSIGENPNNALKEIEEKITNHSWGEQEDDFALVLIKIIG